LEEDPTEPEQPVEEPTDEEEAARRKRVTEKLGKMGGINPFAPRPPVASPPVDDEVETGDSTGFEQPVASPPSAELTSETARRDSEDSYATPPASPPIHESKVTPPPSSEREMPSRKQSAKSVESGNMPEPAAQKDGEY
jgi:hypothetical protein